MPLVSAANLVPILSTDERQTRARLDSLRRAGWIDSTRVGMIEARQQRWFLTGEAVRALYDHDETHETAGADPPASPFEDGSPAHAAVPGRREQLLWTASSRGLRACLRRVAALELLYRIAPGLLDAGWLVVPDSDAAAMHHTRMTDMRLLRRGGWFHAVAHYGERYWVTFTYIGLHATERSLRRKRAHRFWGLDAYASEHDALERAADRVFYGEPKYEAKPSAQVILASDLWAAYLAQRELARSTRPLICTPNGIWGDPVELQPSLDRVDNPVMPLRPGTPDNLKRWQQYNADVVAISDPLAYAVFMAVAQFPAMHSAQIAQLLGEPPRRTSRALGALVNVGVIDRFDGHCYLTEAGLRRAANLSRLQPAALSRRHGAYLLPSFRRKHLRHDQGVNGVVLKFASEGASAFVGWRGDINVPNVTQIRPDLVVLVSDGALGSGAYCLEYERSATGRAEVIDKLRPYRRSAAIGQPVPLLMVCETPHAAERFAEHDTLLPLLVTHQAAAEAGRLTGDATVWRRRGTDAVSLHCIR